MAFLLTAFQCRAIIVTNINRNLQRDAALFHVAARKLAQSLRNGQSAFAYGSTKINLGICKGYIND